MRLGVLGGTFDPPHVGHLLAASDACEALSLDKLLFVPAKVPPYKARTVQASPEQRLQMLALTIGDDPRFEASRLELDRDGLSFTVDTLQALSESEPDASLFMLIGEDLATQIASWRDAARIAELATIVVLARATDGDAQRAGVDAADDAAARRGGSSCRRRRFATGFARGARFMGL